jgi:hypothetical protein
MYPTLSGLFLSVYLFLHLSFSRCYSLFSFLIRLLLYFLKYLILPLLFRFFLFTSHHSLSILSSLYLPFIYSSFIYSFFALLSFSIPLFPSYLSYLLLAQISRFGREWVEIFLQEQSKHVSSLYLYNNGNELSIKYLIKGIDRRVL